MLKNITYILALLLLLSSCTSNQTGNGKDLSDTEIAEAGISEILADPLLFDNKTVRVEGVISHVCRHSGDKMRVLQDGSDLSILVMLGDLTGRFDTQSEGTRLILTGTLVTEVTNLDELEAHSHDGEEHDCESTRQAVEAMKAKGLDANIRTYIAIGGYETL